MTQASDIVAELDRLYRASVDRLQAALTQYLENGTIPERQSRLDGSFAYPEIHVRYRGGDGRPAPRRSFGRLVEPGEYRISVTKPAMFAGYLTEQLTFLIEDYDVQVQARPGRQEIPFPYVLDPGHALSLDEVSVADLSRHFPATELAHIGDEIADGLWIAADDNRPLALFDGLRTDFSLARLRHYTGTPPEHVQQYILFTNYHRYVDEFVRWAVTQLGPDSRFTAVSGAGGIYVEAGDDTDRLLNDSSAWRRHQMPAYHLIAPGNTGITLVNIGVGPSNAKTITDHLAVLRPEAWLMIGHCGGLRPSQRIGDYVLAHAYLRDDHIMDDVLPPEIPIPAIAEVQLALVEHELDRDLRMQLQELLHPRRQPGGAERDRCRHLQGPARPVLALGELRLGHGQLGEDVMRRSIQQLPLLRQDQAARVPVEQRHVEAVLQRADLARDRRLAQIEHLARMREAARFRDGVKNSQLVPIHHRRISSCRARSIAYSAALAAGESSSAASNRSASSAAMQPMPAAVTA